MGTENSQSEIFDDCSTNQHQNNHQHTENLNNSNPLNNSSFKNNNAGESKSDNLSQKCKLNSENLINSEDDVPNISITIDENNVIDGAKEILKVIRTNWNLNNVKFKFFTDGITNKLVGCFYNKSQQISLLSSQSASPPPTNGTSSSSHIAPLSPTEEKNSDVVLIRVYGNNTELLIDRKAEQRNIKLLHKYGFAPTLFSTFKNGLAYEYVPGCTLTTDLIIQPKVWTLIAQRMADMHKVKPSWIDDKKNVEPMLWYKTQTLLNLIPKQFTDKSKHERVSKIFSSIDKLRNEFEDLYKILSKLNSPMVFCHNDLLLGNVIYTENLNRITFIDYEYAAMNYQGFDIGNHFSEFVGIEIAEIDYKRYPSKEFQFEWLEVYLRCYMDLKEDEKVPEEKIEELYVQANQFALASHLFWCIWGLVQGENSKIDFDFIHYSQIRYEEYLAKKDQFLSLKM